MAKFTTVYNNFSGGKVSEKFKGRFDLPIYQNSLEEMTNMFPDKIGGAFKRTGTIEVADLTSFLSGIAYMTVKCIPFDAGDGNTYSIILVSSHTITVQNFATYLKVYRNDGSTTPVYATVTGNQYLSIPNWVPTGPLMEGNWKYAQVGDLLFLTHSSGEQRPLVLARTSESTFELNYVDQYVTGSEFLRLTLKSPYSDKNITPVTITLSAATTLQSSTAFFTQTMVNSNTIIKLNVSGTTYACMLTGYTSSTSVTVTQLYSSATSLPFTDDWRISAWSNPSAFGISGYGWPRSVAYQNQKLVWGGNEKSPDVIWASLTGNIFHLDATRYQQDSSTDVSGRNFFGDQVLGPDPLSIRPASTEANAIQWMTGGRVLTVGTAGGEYLVSGIGTDAIDVKANSHYGSSSYQAIRMGKDILFVGSSKRKLRTYRYSEDNGSWVSDDLAIKIDDFIEKYSSDPYTKSIIDFAWNADHKLLFVTTTDGVYAYGHDPEYGISGWAEIELGTGVVAIGEDTATPLTFVSLRGTNNEETFMIVRRGNAISYTYSLEKITISYLETAMKYNFTSSIFYYADMNRMPRFLDQSNHAQADGSGVVTGLPASFIGREVTASWFNNTVFAYADNIEIISDGAGGSKLDSTFPASVHVIFGYKYSAEFKTLPPEAGGQFGTSLADIKQIHESYLKLYRTKNFSIGSIDKRSSTELNFEDFEYDDLITTDQRVQVMDNPDTDGQIIVRSTTPTPLNVLALMSKGVSYD